MLICLTMMLISAINSRVNSARNMKKVVCTVPAVRLVRAMVVGGRQVALDKLEDFERIAGELKPGQQVTLLTRRADATSYVTLRAAR